MFGLNIIIFLSFNISYINYQILTTLSFCDFKLINYMSFECILIQSIFNFFRVLSFDIKLNEIFHIYIIFTES